MKTKLTLNAFSKSSKVKTLTSKQKVNTLGGVADPAGDGLAVLGFAVKSNDGQYFAIGHYTQVVWA